jgi:hypothetical protein
MKDPAVKNFSISDIANLAIEEIGNISQGPVGPQGPTGAQGVQGNAGTPGVVGPAGLEWQGVWDTDASYNVNDAVSFAGASYFCILNIDTVSNPFPDEDTTHWALLAAQGAQGIQGVQGPTGSQGPAGTISYTEESRNTSSLSIAQNPASTSSKITKNFTRAFVTSGANNFLGLSNIGKDTGDFYVVQNMSTTLDLVVVPLDGTRFLQPNGFASQINFTVKANTYARFTLADNTSGSDKVFMVEVIKPLGAAPTLQQVIDEGNTVSDGSNETMISGGSVIVTSSSNAANVSADNIFFEKQLGSGSVELKFLNTIDAARVINFPNASGTIALTSNIVTKVVKTTITEAQILQMFTTPIPILNSTTAGIAKIPLNILCKRSGAGTAYTIASNQFSLVSNSGNTFTISLNNNILSGAVPVSYTTFSSNANFQISVGVDDEIYKLGFYTSNPTGGTGDMDVYVTYIEITL